MTIMWHCANGQAMPVTSMTDNHLANAYEKFTRLHNAELADVPAMDHWHDRTVADWLVILRDEMESRQYQAEADKRGDQAMRQIEDDFNTWDNY